MLPEDSSKVVKATLTLNVLFRGEDADEGTCKLQLEDIVRFAAAHGHMTGDLSMIVEDFDYKAEAKELDELGQLLESVEED